MSSRRCGTCGARNAHHAEMAVGGEVVLICPTKALVEFGDAE